MACLFLWNDIASEASSVYNPQSTSCNNLSTPLNTNNPDFDEVFDFQVIRNIVGNSHSLAEAHARICATSNLENHFNISVPSMFGMTNEYYIDIPQLSYPDGRIRLRVYDPVRAGPTISNGDIRLIRSFASSGMVLEIIGVGLPAESAPAPVISTAALEIERNDLIDESTVDSGRVITGDPQREDRDPSAGNGVGSTEKPRKRLLEYIPFFSYLSNAASTKAFSVVLLGCLWAVVSIIIGGGYVAYTLYVGSYGNTIYSLMLLLMMVGGSFGVAELIVVQVLMISGLFNQDPPPAPVADDKLPTVLVQIPVRHEPVEVVMETVRRAIKIDYLAGKLSIQVIDNSTTIDGDGNHITGNSYELLKDSFDSDQAVSAFNEINGEGSAVLLHRDSTIGYKSGNLNMGLAYDEERRNSQYVLQLDADSFVEPESLRVVMPEFVHHEAARKEGEPKLAFVQIALDVSNPHESVVAWVVSGMHHIFEMFIMPVRADYRFVSSFGHHIIFSHEAVTDAGMHPEDIRLAEDADIAIAMQIAPNEIGMRKWVAKRISYHALKESVPSSFRALKIQRWRWAFGNTRVGIKRFSDVLKSDMLWHEKFFVLLDLASFLIIVFLLVIPAYLVPPGIVIAQITGGVVYPEWLSAGILLQWLTPFTLLYVSSLMCFSKKTPQAAIDAILGFIANTSLLFTLTPTLVNAAISGLIHKRAAFKITPRNNDFDTSLLDIFRDNRSEVLSGIYFLIFIPFMPLTIGYSIPAFIMGFSLIAWPYHNKISSAAVGTFNKLKDIISRNKILLSKKGVVLQDGSESVGWKRLALSGVLFISIAAALRFINLDYLGPWMDEATYIDAGRDFMNPARDWGWINGWKYAFPLVAWFGTHLFGSFVGARYMTAILGMPTLLIVYLFSRCVMSDLFKDQPAQNERRSLFALGALSFAMPLVFISRLATYDTLAYFFVALSLYFIHLGAKPNREKLLVIAAVSLTLGFMSKYVVFLLMPFIASYALLITKDKDKWLKWYVAPFMITLLAFLVPSAKEIAVGISLTGKGFWVNTSIIGVTLSALKIIAPYLMLSIIGYLKIPKERRAHAWWLLGGSLILFAYHIYDRHVQAMTKDLSIYLIFCAPMIGAGLSWLMSVKIHIKKSMDWLYRFALIGTIVLSGYFVPRNAMVLWDDLYAPVRTIHEYASIIKSPSIFTTRPHELVMFYPDLEAYVNQHVDSVSLKPSYARYANTRYVQNGDDTVLDILAGRYDIVHVTSEILEDWNTDDLTYSLNIKRALKKGGYVRVLYDDKPSRNELGVTRRPSYSAVYVHPRVYTRSNPGVEPVVMPVLENKKPKAAPVMEPTINTPANNGDGKSWGSGTKGVSVVDDAAKNGTSTSAAASAPLPMFFLMMLSTMEGFNKRFQRTYISPNKPVVYIVPSDVIHESHRRLRTELNKLSGESLRPEKFCIVNVDGLPDEERAARILERVQHYRDKYNDCTIIAAAKSGEEMSFMRNNNIRSLIFRNIDIYTILTALRASYRAFYGHEREERQYGLEAVMLIYKNITGNEFSVDNVNYLEDEGALYDILKALIFEVPPARRFDYDNELISPSRNIRLLITFA